MWRRRFLGVCTIEQVKKGRFRPIWLLFSEESRFYYRLFHFYYQLFEFFYQLSAFFYQLSPFHPFLLPTFRIYFQLSAFPINFHCLFPTFMVTPTPRPSLTPTLSTRQSNQKTTPPGHQLQRVRPNRVILFFISVKSQYIDSVHGLPSGFPHRSGSQGQHGSPCARRMAWPRGKRDD